MIVQVNADTLGCYGRSVVLLRCPAAPFTYSMKCLRVMLLPTFPPVTLPEETLTGGGSVQAIESNGLGKAATTCAAAHGVNLAGCREKKRVIDLLPKHP
jgi:hypothetical protein